MSGKEKEETEGDVAVAVEGQPLDSADETGIQSTKVKGDDPALASPAVRASVKRHAQRQFLDKFYAVPIQRELEHSDVSKEEKEEEEEEEEEKEEWESMFMDLFYVPAISNLSEQFADNLKYTEEDGECCKFTGSVLFFASFFAVWSTWYHHCLWQSKYISRDHLHHGVNRVRYLFVAVAIGHIRNYEKMMSHEDTASYYFCMGIVLECAISTLMRAHVALRGETEFVRKDGISSIVTLFLPRLCFYAAAWAIQGTSEAWPWLVLVGALLPTGLSATVEHFHLDSMVPVSTEVYFGRISAWVTIVMGEGVISLVNPNVYHPGAKWHVVMSLVTIMMIHSIYFFNGGQLQLRPRKFRGLLQATLVQLLSLALIGISVFSKEGFETMHELEHFDRATDTDLEESQIYAYIKTACQGAVHLDDEKLQDIEAEQPEPKYPVLNEWQANRAYLVCLPLVLLVLECIFWSSNHNFLKQIKDGTLRAKVFIFTVIVFQLAALASVGFTGVYLKPFYSLTPLNVMTIGFFLTVAFYLIRVLFVGFLADENKDEDKDDD